MYGSGGFFHRAAACSRPLINREVAVGQTIGRTSFPSFPTFL